MTANDTQRAVALLRTRLPEPYQPTPRLVHTTTEALDGIAFCHNHKGEPIYVCLSCWVIDIHEPHLAELIVALLRAAEPTAAHLNALDSWGHDARQPKEGGVWSCPVCGPLAQPERCPAWSAADITRAINTAVAR